MRILVTPERLSELAGQFQQVSGGLLDVGYYCQGALASLDWEVRQKASVEGEVQAAVRQARALAERAGELARFLQSAAQRFAEADQQELPFAGWAVLGASAPPPFWRLPEARAGGVPFVPFPRVVTLATGTALGGLSVLLSWTKAVPADWAERVWNWLHGRGWKTNRELAQPVSQKGRLYETVMRGFERAKPKGPPADTRPLTAEKDAVHPLRPADPRRFDPRYGCVQYAISRRPNLRVTDAPIPGAADYIPYYEKKGQVLRLRGTETDLRQYVKPGHAVVWPRNHPDLKGTGGWTNGHVAIVEEVGPNYVKVSQAGWGDKVEMIIPKEKLTSLAIIL